MIIGLIAATLGVIAFMPQTYKTIKSRSAGDFSWGWLFLLAGSTTTWTTYGIILSDIPIIACNILISLALLAIMFVKWRYRD